MKHLCTLSHLVLIVAPWGHCPSFFRWANWDSELSGNSPTAPQVVSNKPGGFQAHEINSSAIPGHLAARGKGEYCLGHTASYFLGGDQISLPPRCRRLAISAILGSLPPPAQAGLAEASEKEQAPGWIAFLEQAGEALVRAQRWDVSPQEGWHPRGNAVPRLWL